MLSDSLTWLAALAFAMSIGVWFKWVARRVSDEDEPPMRLVWPLLVTGAFVSLLFGAILTYSAGLSVDAPSWGAPRVAARLVGTDAGKFWVPPPTARIDADLPAAVPAGASDSIRASRGLTSGPPVGRLICTSIRTAGVRARLP